MKLHLNLKNKEASFDADIEGVVEKKLEYDSKNHNKKTRYQIKQEEKRKNAEIKVKNPKRKTRFQIKQEEKRKNLELKHKIELEQKRIKAREDRNALIGCIVFLTILLIFGFIASILGI